MQIESMHQSSIFQCFVFMPMWFRNKGALIGATVFQVLIVTSGLAQSTPTLINLATQAHNADFAAFLNTKPVSVGPALPGTCVVGQLFFLLNDGRFLWLCTQLDTWTAWGAPLFAKSVPAHNAPGLSSTHKPPNCARDTTPMEGQ